VSLESFVSFVSFVFFVSFVSLLVSLAFLSASVYFSAQNFLISGLAHVKVAGKYYNFLSIQHGIFTFLSGHLAVHASLSYTQVFLV